MYIVQEKVGRKWRGVKYTVDVKEAREYARFWGGKVRVVAFHGQRYTPVR